MNTSDFALQNLKRLLWLYFWLLIFEGALRKWILPSLSTPLLLVRDPVVLLIYAMAAANGIFPRNAFIRWTLVLAVLSFLASFAGIGNLKVTLYGLRTNFLHLPLIFLIPKIFGLEDVKKVGRWLLILSVPMALLAVQQFRSSPDARINAGAGGELGGQLTAALGKIRPSGLFSFVTGMVSYLALVAAYLFCHFLDGKNYPRVLVIVSIPAMVLSIGVSGSRSAVASVVLVLLMAVFVCVRRGAFSTAFLKYALAIYLVYAGLSLFAFFREGLMVQRTRFEGGGGIHEGLIERFFGELMASVEAGSTAPLLGLGLGLGTNAGAGLVSGSRQFLLSEDEWGRVILESGPILGGAFIVLRFGILVHLWKAGMRKLQSGSSLSLLLLSSTGLDLVTGQFGQPTALGFIVLASGLCLAAAREEECMETTPGGNSGAGEPGQDGAKRIRGRSAYAEALHGEK